MKISGEKPPIFDEANKLFKIDELGLKPIFAFGKIIFNPYHIEITGDLLIHEQTHAKQQNYDPAVAKVWWDRYLIDPKFRVEQETEAYAAQYKFLCKSVPDRNKQAKMLWRIAEILSGDLYGRAIGHTEAMAKIRAYSK